MGEYRAQLGLVRMDDGVPRHTAAVSARFFPEGAVWVGICDELGTSAYADSIEEARTQLAEAIVLHLNEAQRLGFIDELLKTRGVVVMRVPDPTPATKGRSNEWELALAGK